MLSQGGGLGIYPEQARKFTGYNVKNTPRTIRQRVISRGLHVGLDLYWNQYKKIPTVDLLPGTNRNRWPRTTQLQWQTVHANMATPLSTSRLFDVTSSNGQRKRPEIPCLALWIPYLRRHLAGNSSAPVSCSMHQTLGLLIAPSSTIIHVGPTTISYIYMLIS